MCHILYSQQIGIISRNIIKDFVFMMGAKCKGGIHELCMEGPMYSIIVRSLFDSTGPIK